MHCPKCGTANPEDARLCSSCGSDLPVEQKAESKPEREISLKALCVSTLGHVLMFLPLYLASFVSTVISVITMIWLVVHAVRDVREIKKSDRPLKLKIIGYVVPVLSDLLLVATLLYSLDAEPIPNDYTVADFRSAGAEYAETYELLNSLSDPDEGHLSERGALGTGLSNEDVEVIEQVARALGESDYSNFRKVLAANSVSIKRAWEDAGRGREIISKLSGFGEIADLTEPDWNAFTPFLPNLRKLARLYRVYVCLQTEQGDNTAAVRHLIELDLMFRKLSVNSRSMVMKLECIAGLAGNMRTANFVANNPGTSKESLELLAEHFRPLTDEQLSMRNQIICEYLTFKNAFRELPFVGRWPAVKNLPFFKRNSTLRVSRNWFNRMLDVREGPNGDKRKQLSVWPWLYPDFGPVSVGSDGKLPWYYRRYNHVGSMLLTIGMPALGNPFRHRSRLKVEGELLRIVLNKRLGRQVSLKACAYSDEYIVDIEKKMILSPGPDGERGTEDDIKLPIDPNVLRWTE
ncbi:MAG: zinc-ribbon domain-containing protein [Planctomycetota bacterium]|jgi:predicted nucleic acid-binding Zn ribbon protein